MHDPCNLLAALPLLRKRNPSVGQCNDERHHDGEPDQKSFAIAGHSALHRSGARMPSATQGGKLRTGIDIPGSYPKT
jgi:hypothetical protein